MAQITVTGNLFDPTGTAIVGAPVWFEIVNLNGNVPFVSGTNVVVPLKVIATTTTGGAFSIQIQGNDTITPANTFYKVTFNNNQVTYYSLVGGGPINLNSYPQLTVFPVPTGLLPTNLLSSNNIFTGSNSFTGTFSITSLLNAPAGIKINAGQVLAWTNDTGISRDSAGVLDFGNGTQGDKSGSINLTGLVATGAVNLSAGSLTLPELPAAVFPTGAGQIAVGFSGAAAHAVGDGTNSRLVPLKLYSAMVGTATGNVTVLTSVLTAPTYVRGSSTLVANQQISGSLVHIHAEGSITVGTSQTITFTAFINGQAAWSGSCTSVPATATNWVIDVWIFCSAVGGSGVAAMRSYGTGAIMVANTNAHYPLLGSFVNITTGVATTSTQALDLQMDFGTTNAGNTCQMQVATMTLE